MQDNKFPCGAGCDFVAKTASGLKAHQRGSKCTRVELPEYLAVAAIVASDSIDDGLIVETARAVEDVKLFKYYAAAYSQIKKEFPWKDKIELLEDLVTVPGKFRELYLEAEALGSAMYKERSLVDNALYKPHDSLEWPERYRAVMGSHHELGGVLLERLDAAWAAAKGQLKEKVADLFKNDPDMMGVVLSNIKAWEADSAS